MTVKRMDAALRRMVKAQQVARARSEDVVALAESLGQTAVMKHVNALVRDWCDRHLLRDLATLRDALSTPSPDALPAELRTLREVPGAIIQWLEDRFGVTPHGTPGEEWDLPAHRLAQFDCDFEAPRNPDALIRVRVVASGWKRGRRVLVPAAVSRIPG